MKLTPTSVESHTRHGNMKMENGNVTSQLTPSTFFDDKPCKSSWILGKKTQIDHIPPYRLCLPPMNLSKQKKHLILLLNDITRKYGSPKWAQCAVLGGGNNFLKKIIKRVFFRQKTWVFGGFASKGKIMGETKKESQCRGNLWFFFEIKSYFCESFVRGMAVVRMTINQKKIRKNKTFAWKTSKIVPLRKRSFFILSSHQNPCLGKKKFFCKKNRGRGKIIKTFLI